MMHMPVLPAAIDDTAMAISMATEWNISRPLSKTEIPHLTMHQCSAAVGITVAAELSVSVHTFHANRASARERFTLIHSANAEENV
jgi:hypothetical protein